MSQEKNKKLNETQSINGKKKVSLALQGGGSHGAYTWGVVDALLANENIQIEGVCGTSAGAMNATAIVQGLIREGNAGARMMLKSFWDQIGQKGVTSPLHFTLRDKEKKNFTLEHDPILKVMQYLGSIMSPYDSSYGQTHPLQDIVDNLFDYKVLQSSTKYKLFLCATHIATGKLKIFSGQQITSQSLLASACVPSLFKSIEVDGEYYWDGGFIGNPPIYPLIYYCDTPDIIVIQIRRIHDPNIPKSVNDINNRLGEITQNACLNREVRAISFITKLIDDGIIPPGKLKRLYMHMIRDDAFFGKLDRSTGFCADPDFLAYLFEAGQKFGKTWLAENFEHIGIRSTARLEEDFL